LCNVILTPVVIAIVITKEMSIFILILIVIICLPPCEWPHERSKRVGNFTVHKIISIFCMLLVLRLHYIWYWETCLSSLRLKRRSDVSVFWDVTLPLGEWLPEVRINLMPPSSTAKQSWSALYARWP